MSAKSAARPSAVAGRDLRIFHIVNSLEMGGSEHQMVEVASRQSAGLYKVTVGCLAAKGVLLKVLQQAGISVFEFNPRGGLLHPRGIYQMLRLTRFLRQQRFDVVQSHDLYSNLLAVPAAWLARVPVILSCRRDLGHWWWYTSRHRVLLRRIQNLSTFVVANSQAVCDLLVQQDGFNPNIIRVVRNSVDFERFVNIPRDRTRLFPNLSAEDKLIAVVANMNVETKGHTDLIRAAVEVSRDVPQARFLLIGDGPQRPRIESMAGELGLRDNVLFLGRRGDIPELLACCDMSVLPSWAEGLPNSVLEAMAAGLPVVATRVGGTPEIIEDGVSGLLVPPRDANLLATGIRRILLDAKFGHELGRAAQQQVCAKFSFDRLVTELAELYAEGLQYRRKVVPRPEQDNMARRILS